MKKIFLIAFLAVLAPLAWIPAISIGASLFTVDDSGNIGIGNTSPLAKLDVSGAMYSRLVTASSTVNWNSGNVQSLTLSVSTSTVVFNNGRAGGQYQLIVKQDSTGSRAVVWPASVKWPGGSAPTLSSSGNSADVINFTYDGTNYLGSYHLGYGTSGIAFDASSFEDYTESESSLTWSHTASGNNRLLVVCGASYQSDFTGATYNGDPMTEIDDFEATTFDPNTYIACYGLLSPDTGTHNIVLSRGGSSGWIQGAAASYTGVAQSGFPDAHETNEVSATTTYSNSITTIADNTWGMMFSMQHADGTPTAGANTVLRTANPSGGMTLSDSGAAWASSGSHSLGMNSSSSGTWSTIMVSFAPAD